MHVGTMDHGIRIAEAGAELRAQRHVGHGRSVDRIEQQQAFGVDRARTRTVAHAQRVERRERIRPQLDAGADLVRLLEHPHSRALLRERERHGQAADAAAGNEHFALRSRCAADIRHSLPCVRGFDADISHGVDGAQRACGMSVAHESGAVGARSLLPGL